LLRSRGVRPGRERPKPEMPRPWQQALAAAEGRTFDTSAPSLTAPTPLEPWRETDSKECHAKAPAERPAAPRGPTAQAATAAETGASIAGTARSAPANSPSIRCGLSAWRSLALWCSWRARRKRTEARTHEAMRAQTPLKRIRAARLPMVPGSPSSPGEQLRRIDAAVEAVSSFQRASKFGRDLDRTFLLLAYASPLPLDSRAYHNMQQSSAATPCGIPSPSDSQQGKAVPGELQHVSRRRAAEDEGPAAQPQAVGPDAAQVPRHGRRLSFQPGGGFGTSGIRDTKQQGSIPDLISLMCGASPDSMPDSTPDSSSSQGDPVAGNSDAGMRSRICSQQCLIACMPAPPILNLGTDHHSMTWQAVLHPASIVHRQGAA
jgi:hypothetical protein